MRLTIFGRVICAQIFLIGLLLAQSLYILSQLHDLSRLSADILTLDSECVAEEKRLLQLFLTQMRSAEKYLILQDKVFYNSFTRGSSDVARALSKIKNLADSTEEQSLLEQINALYTRYAASLATAHTRKRQWEREKTELSEGITGKISALIALRERAIDRKTASARDQATLAASVLNWLTLGGISAAVLLAYFFARGVSQPLKKLAQELRYVGRGEFRRSLEIRAPKEVNDLAQAFNWMAEQLAELEEMKSDFIAHVSHELRTPLTAIQEGTALLLEEIPGPLTTSQKEIVTVVRSHSERLFHSLLSVLDLSKMEAGMLEYVPVPSDVTALMERSVATVGLIAQKKQLSLSVVPTHPLPLVSCDEQRIQQVLDNLLSNAVKFTSERGQISLSAILKPGTNGTGGWVEVCVTDTGEGIPEEEVERIFEKFYQSSHHRNASRRGTGLGLAIAQHIIDAHGGRIWAESRLGEGSTFHFTLPIHHNEGVREHAKSPASVERREGVYAVS